MQLETLRWESMYTCALEAVSMELAGVALGEETPEELPALINYGDCW